MGRSPIIIIIGLRPYLTTQAILPWGRVSGLLSALGQVHSKDGLQREGETKSILVTSNGPVEVDT